jgi:AcrR family transcriptional regulator
VVEKRRHPLSLEEIWKLPLIRLLAHGGPLGGSWTRFRRKRNCDPAYTIRNGRPVCPRKEGCPMSRSGTPLTSAGITTVDAVQARPLRADARRNRDRVLEAARSAFGAEGSDVSLDEIARRAGVGPGTVYRHFPTKEALFEAVVFDRIGELVEEGTTLLDGPDPGRAFASFVEDLAREGAHKRDLVETLAHDGVHLQLGEAPIVRALTDVLAELLVRAQQARAVRSDVSVEDVMAVVTGAAYAICHSRADDERTHRLLAIMYDGLRAHRQDSRGALAQ